MKPEILVKFFPARISGEVEIPGGWEAIVANPNEFDCCHTGTIIRHDTSEEAISEILRENGWDVHKCLILIQPL